MTTQTLPLPTPNRAGALSDLVRRIKDERLHGHLPKRFSARTLAIGIGLTLAVLILLNANLLWLFVLIFLDGIVPLVPGEAALLSQAPAAFAAGWPAALGLAGVAAVAAFLGDTTTYLLGRRVGTDRFAWQRHPRVARLLKSTDTQIDRRGLPLIVSARLLPGWRVAVTFMAGATRLSPPRFLVASALGATLWATYLLGIGTTVGAVTGGGPLVVALVSLATTAVLAQAVRWLRPKLQPGLRRLRRRLQRLPRPRAVVASPAPGAMSLVPGLPRPASSQGW